MNYSNHVEELNVNLPLLLAGPIVRRADKSKICIWISTSKNVQSKIKIFRIIKPTNQSSDKRINSNDNIFFRENDTTESGSNLQLIGEGINSPVQLGDNLFVNLVIASPLKNDGVQDSQSVGNLIEFPTNELLAYDMELVSHTSETGDTKTISLKDLGLLSGENSIVYSHQTIKASSSSSSFSNSKDGFHYPSLPMFFIPDTVKSSLLNLLYGSCRKLYGDDEDSLLIGDKLLHDFTYDLTKRPSALFLMGDQIYADNVADPLIAFIKKLSSRLLGWQEGLNGVERKLDELSAGERKEIVSDYAKFSTDEGHNHLLGFGEFAAMYLVAWNQLLWPSKFDQIRIDDLTSSASIKKYINELKELEQSRRSLVRIRRLLANIPTYMICDDHEITDDWNINKKWRDDVDQSICGKQIISNGLLAFWAFQAWGNDPESFDEDFIDKVKRCLYLNKESNESFPQTYQQTIAKSSVTSPNTKDRVVNMEMDREMAYRFMMSINWTFVAPTYPLSVFLDCRTQRTFVDEEGPPHLLSDEALDCMKSMLIESGYRNGDPIILVSPTPVFGFELAESIQHFLTSISGSYKWDLETWRANERGFVKFLAYLANNFNPSYCIFLSGDVHYAFTMKSHFERLKLTHEIGSYTEIDSNKEIVSSMPIVQLTSSPFRSNSLTNRIVAILILNLVHKVIVSKNFLLRRIMVIKSRNEGPHLNYDYFKLLPNINDAETKPNTLNNYNYHKQKIYFSKHNNNKSLLEKIKVISFNLIVRYLKKNKNDRKLTDSPWAEHRLLIKPKGQGTLPVLARNNIGYVCINTSSKSIKHTLCFREKGNTRYIEAFINFEY